MYRLIRTYMVWNFGPFSSATESLVVVQQISCNLHLLAVEEAICLDPEMKISCLIVFEALNRMMKVRNAESNDEGPRRMV